jgi:peptidylprolyl isomerase
MSKAEIAKLPQYKIRAMPPPAPRKLVVKDLWKGFGAALKPGDDFLVDFVGIRYSHAYETTPATQNEPIKFGFEEVMAGWRKGLPGMKVGGRRQLIVPPRLGSVSATAVYVIDLLAVYPAG